LVADVRPSSRTKPSICQKIKYNNRSDTPGSCLASDRRWSATRALLLAPHKVRGWINYYGAFYRSMLYSLAARIDEHLVRWALQKFKRLRGRPTRAWRWLDTVRRRQPTLFAHWYLLPSTPRRTVGAV